MDGGGGETRVIIPVLGPSPSSRGAQLLACGDDILHVATPLRNLLTSFWPNTSGLFSFSTSKPSAATDADSSDIRLETEEDLRKTHIYQINTSYSDSASGDIRRGFCCLLSEVDMLRPQVQVLLVALFSAVLLVQVSGAPRRDRQTETLTADLVDDKDLAHLLLLSFVSGLMAARVDQMLPEPGEEEVGVREEVVRRHLPLSQRERKAGCRSFFWKTFTSC
ncbi:uncharacterized protein sst5 [Xiphias gladius]|uniref:uncharacterized protein sst5 n=1 Tax=Xiphias gladius TaxID=8245 RepID=UPI001A9873BE|nr:uncharacterized protein sst5 [Xiphias gladius]XP_039996198.1 uncharacterized protein sst5 [Xiphias gladius]XP_039996199.1 uncharacterized protein sst5 [Xiphias gladius]XP_039996201.1 uncharacterized protein sst5 [Xiphias gladius]XP_039996202.1 uncharacterized protein sst5 [Xiphias gladius]XP_039996203.1 uncharacterized protein sst5 [Xiphias gladius]